MLTKDGIRAGFSDGQIIFVSENAANLCQHLPFQMVRKDVVPDGRDGRKERDSAQIICVEDDRNDVFQITVQVVENVLHLFNVQCFRTRADTKPITYVGFGHLEEAI